MKKPHIILSEEEQDNLRVEYKKTKERPIAERILCILLVAQGRTYQEVASILMVNLRTIKRWVKMYKNRGMKRLCRSDYNDHPPNSKLTKEQEGELKKHLEKVHYTSAKAVASYIYETYKVEYTITGVQKLLQRLGFSYKKTTPIPGKADVQRQEEFLMRYEKIKQELEPGDKVYFVDAVHLLHNAVHDYAWLPKGVTIGIPTNTGRRRVNILGAYNPDSMDLLHIETQDKCNAETVKELMDKIKEANPGTKRIILILDNASYHRAKSVKEHAKELGISLEFLPPYSPNLNLIERFWKFMKKHIVKNRYYPVFEQFIAKIRDFLRNIGTYKQELMKLISENFQILQPC